MESQEKLQDPRKKTQKHKSYEDMVEECPKKRWKTQTDVQDSTTIPAIFANEQNFTLEKEDMATSFIDGIILHVTDSEN